MEKKAIIAMSGGVDSSVAALLCEQQGFDCVGVTLALTSNQDRGVPQEEFPGERTCCSVDDVADARSVAFRLDMPFYVFNFKEAFRREVMDRFVTAYEEGLTPNPCVDCNRYIKFEKLMRRGEEIGYPYVATGHYAQVEQDQATGRWLLKKGLDESKDQSYMLYALTQWELSRLLLPLGELTKDQVRQLAEEHGFINARKRDSQDICFVPDGDYAALIQHRTGRDYPAGPFLDQHGAVLGQHRGIIHYTVGQRRGLGVSSNQGRLYVQQVRPQENTVVLGDNASLFHRGLTVRGLNLIPMERLNAPLRVWAKVRYRMAPQPAILEQTGPDCARLTFDKPQRAITPGQSAVFYDGAVVIGGGIIQETAD